MTEDVQPVADLGFLEFAEIGVKACEISVFVLAGHADIAVEPGGGGKAQDLAAEMFDPPGIDAGGFVILVHQRLEITQRAVAFGAGERRGEVIDDDRLRAALGLCALAGVVHDEGVDMRDRT